MGFFDFIKRWFSLDETDELIDVSDGRAVCFQCDKILDGKIYMIKGDKRYYCKKHAKSILQNRKSHEIETEKKDAFHKIKKEKMFDAIIDSDIPISQKIEKSLKKVHDTQFKKNIGFDKNIIISDGRASCFYCDKILDGKVYMIKGDKRYYCKKHAKQILQNRRDNDIFLEETEEKSILDSTKRVYHGHCEFCGKVAKGLDVYQCSYCHKYHCSNHRIPEDHGCTSDLNQISKDVHIFYSRN